MKIFVIASTLALVLLYPQLVAAREPIAHRPVGNTRVVLGQTWIKNAARKGLAGADVAFLRSPAGVAYQEKLQAVDVQINAVYEQFLNIYYVDPGTEEGRRSAPKSENCWCLSLQNRSRLIRTTRSRSTTARITAPPSKNNSRDGNATNKA